MITPKRDSSGEAIIKNHHGFQIQTVRTLDKVNPKYLIGADRGITRMIGDLANER